LPNQDISAQVSVNERFEFFSNSFKIFQEYPFFGTGPGSFSYFNPIFQTQSLVNSEHPHNLFLKILSESGLFTAISFTAWIAILIIYFGRSILHSLKRKHVISLIVLIGLLIASLVDYNFGFPIIWILFFGLLGFLRTELFNSAYSVSPTFKAINVWILTLVLTLIILFQSVVFTFSMSQKLQNSFIYDFIANNIILNKLAFHNDFIVSVDNASLSEDYFKKYTYSYPNFNLSYLALAKNTTNLNLKSQAYLNYLKLDKFNNFEPYYYLLQNSPDSVNYDFLLDLLEQYTYLISLNTHQTVTSSQPNFVYLIYELLIEQKPNNLLLRDQFLQFQTVLFAEQQKFDTRYKTHLNKQFVKWKQEKS
jgi:hypothetical protein